MYGAILLKGIALGFALAVPVGPIGVLCIQRSLTYGTHHGFATGFGAATADAFYGAVAAFGLATVSTTLIEHQYGIQLVGGIFLIILGVITLLARPSVNRRNDKSSGLLSSYFSSLILTATNPITAIIFIAAIATLGMAAIADDYVAATVLVAGVFTGSALWLSILSSIAGYFRTSVSNSFVFWANRVSGGLIIFFGVVALLSLGSSQYPNSN